jgi:hypothetical protein
MVIFLLFVKAELENVKSLSLSPSAYFCLTVKNPLSDYELREKVVVNPTETIEQGSRVEPDHHFRLSWDGSKKASTLTVLTDAQVKTAFKKKKGAVVPRSYTSDDSGTYVPLLAVECRGLEPTAFFPMGHEFIVISAGGAEFSTDVDLSDGDWADYDADHDQAVAISNAAFKWESA